MSKAPEEPIKRVIESEIIKRAMSYAKKFFKDAGVHGWEHVERVLDISLKIGIQEGADLEVLALSAILHDIARKFEEEGLIEDHAIESAKMAKKFLEELKYPKAEAVYEAIISHSFSTGVSPKSLEGKILSDADKIDAMGAIGVARVFMYSGEHGRTIEDSIKHFYEKILRLKDMIYTNTGKKIAEERHKFVEIFVKRLEEELSGIK